MTQSLPIPTPTIQITDENEQIHFIWSDYYLIIDCTAIRDKSLFFKAKASEGKFGLEAFHSLINTLTG